MNKFKNKKKTVIILGLIILLVSSFFIVFNSLNSKERTSTRNLTLASPVEQNANLIDVDVYLATTATNPVKYTQYQNSVTGVYDQYPIGTSGKFVINVSFSEEGYTFNNGVIEITNYRKPLLMATTGISTGTDSIDTLILDEKGTADIGDDSIILQMQPSVNPSQFQIAPSYTHPNDALKFEDYLTANNKVIITGTIQPGNIPVVKVVEIDTVFVGTLDLGVDEANKALDIKTHTEDSIFAIYTLGPGVLKSPTGHVGKLGIAESDFEVNFPMVDGKHPINATVTLSGIKTNNAASSGTTAPPVNFILDGQGRKSGFTISRDADFGTGILVYGASLAQAYNYLYLAKITLEYEKPSDIYMQEHVNDNFNLTGTLSAVPFYPVSPMPEQSIDFSINAQLGDTTGELFTASTAAWSHNDYRATNIGNLKDGKQNIMGVIHNVNNLLPDVAKEAEIVIKDFKYQTKDPVTGELSAFMPVASGDICIKKLNVTSTVFSSGQLGSAGRIYVYDRDTDELLGEMKTGTVNLTFNVPSTTCNVRLVTTAAVKANTNMAINTEYLISSSFVQKLSARDEIDILENIQTGYNLNVRLDGDDDYLELTSTSFDQKIPQRAYNAAVARQLPITAETVFNDLVNDQVHTIAVKLPTSRDNYSYARNPVFYLDIPTNIIVSDVRLNPDLNGDLGLPASSSGAVTVGGIQVNPKINFEYYKVVLSATNKTYTNVYKFTLPGVYENIPGVNYEYLYIDIVGRLSPVTTGATTNVTFWTETTEQFYGTTTYADTQDVNLNGSKTDQMLRLRISFTTPFSNTIVSAASTIFDDKRVYSPQTNIVYPDNKVTLNAQLSNGLQTGANNKITNIKALIRLPFEGNKDFDNVTDLGSTFTAPLKMPSSGPIIVKPRASSSSGANISYSGEKYYYSTVAEPSEDPLSGDWTTVAPTTQAQLDQIKNIMIDFGAFQLDISNRKIEIELDALIDESIEAGNTANYAVTFLYNYINDAVLYRTDSQKADFLVKDLTKVNVNNRVYNYGTEIVNVPGGELFQVTFVNVDNPSVTEILYVRDNQTLSQESLPYGMYNVTVAPISGYSSAKIYMPTLETGDTLETKEIEEILANEITQIEISETTPVIDLVIIQRYLNPLVTEKFVDLNSGTVLDTNVFEIRSDLEINSYRKYKSELPYIALKTPVAFKVGNLSQVYFSSEITSTSANGIDSDIEIIYYYDVDLDENGRRDSQNGTVIEKFRTTDNSLVKPDNTINVALGVDDVYNVTMPALYDGTWEYKGYKLGTDDTLIPSNTININPINDEFIITYIYSKGQRPLTINYKNNSTVLKTQEIEDLEIGTSYSHNPENPLIISGRSWIPVPNSAKIRVIADTGNVLDFDYVEKTEDITIEYYYMDGENEIVFKTEVVTRQVGTSYTHVPVEEIYNSLKYTVAPSQSFNITVSDTVINKIRVRYNPKMSTDNLIIKYVEQGGSEFDLQDLGRMQVGTNYQYTVDAIKNMPGRDWSFVGTPGDKSYTVVENSNVITLTYTKVLHTNANLTDIKINGSSIDVFDGSGIGLEHTVARNVSALDITYTKEVPTSTVTGGGVVSFDGNTTVYILTVTAEDETTTKTYSITVDRSYSDNANLSMMQVNGTPVEGFNKNLITYTVNVGNSITTASITYTVEDTGYATANISGPSSLVIGDNTYTITVTADDGSNKVYTVVVNRAASNNAYLSEIKVNNVLVDGFDKEIDTYTINVLNNVTSLAITYETEEQTATANMTGPGSLSVGNNTYTITVTAQGGGTGTYIVNVNRAANSNANLASLTVDGYSFEGGVVFAPNTTNYTVTVPNNKTTFGPSDIEATAEEITTTVNKGSEISLSTVVGNTYTISGIAEDGTVKNYVILIIREKNSNATLGTLTTGSYSMTPILSNGVYAYTVTVPNSKTTFGPSDVEAIPTVSTSSVISQSEISLTTSVSGNAYTITVTAEDGTIEVYNLTIIRLKNSDATLSTLTTVYDISPTLTADEYNYTVTVPYTKGRFGPSDITAIANKTTSQVTKDSEIMLVTGDVGNIYNIEVTAEDGTTQNYRIKVIRLKNSDATLSSLTINGYTFDNSAIFNSTTYAYTVTVPNNKTTFGPSDVEAIPTISSSNVALGNEISLTTSDTGRPYTITVTAEDGTDQNYIITVKRQKSNNAELTGIRINGSDIDVFNTSGVGLTHEVPRGTPSLSITYTTSSSLAVVTGAGIVSFNGSTQVYTLTVTAEDGTTKTYEITVNRAISTNANLNRLGVTGQTLTPPFGANTLSYTIAVPNEVSSAEITGAVVDTGYATVTGLGVKALNVGANVFNIVVTAEDLSTKTYTVTITRAANADATLASLSLNGGLTFDGGVVFSTTRYAYTVIVPNSKTTFGPSDITTIPTNLSSTVTPDTIINLNTSDAGNAYNVHVVAESGAESNYVITVKRQKNSDASLSNISLNGGLTFDNSAVFNSTTYAYTVTVPNSKTTFGPSDVNATATMGTTIVSKDGSKALNTSIIGNTYTVKGTAEDGTILDYVITVIREKNSDTTLKTLTTGSYSMTPALSNGVYAYTVTVPNNKTKFGPNDVLTEATISTSTVLEDTEITLTTAVTGNPYNVLVTAEDGSTQNYVITVIRTQSSNANLDSLSVSTGSLLPTFDTNTTSYTVDVSNSVTNITINAVAADSEAIVSNVGMKSLNVGENQIDVTVTAENGSILIYQIIVNRAPSSDAKLTDILVNGTSIGTITSGVYNYSYDVIRGVDEVEFTVVKSDATSTVELPSSVTFNENTQTYTITVTAQDTTTVINYSVTINRIRLNNTDLDSLTVSEGALDPVFDKDTLSYTVGVANSITSIDIAAVVDDIGYASVIGTGTKTLIVGPNIYTIVVTADNGSTKSYAINVVRGASSNAELTDILVNGTSIGTITSGVYNYSYDVIRGVDEAEFSVVKSDATSTVMLPSSTSFNENTQIYTITVLAEDGVTEETYTITVSRTRDDNADLDSLTVSEGTLTPAFDKDITSYTVDVLNNITSIDIDAVVNDIGYASVTGTGTKTLIVGVNSYTITVTADDGTTKDYVIDVNRASSSNAELTDISVNGTSIGTVVSGTYGYTAEVPRGIDDVVFTVVKADSTSTVTLPSSTTFNEDIQNYIIVVTAQDGLTSTNYTVTVNRTRDDNADLDSLTVSEGTLTPVFDKDITSYTVDVLNNITSIDINAVVSDTGYASVSGIGTKTLIVGVNSYTITVEADDGSTKNYVVTINRAASSNAELSDILVNGTSIGTIVSGTNSYSYDVVRGIDDVVFTVVKIDSTSTVTLPSSTTFNENTQIYIITVLAEDGVTEEIYTITVNRTRDDNADLSSLTVSEGTLLPVIDKDTTSYTVDVSNNITSIDINAVVEDTGYASVSGDGTKTLVVGSNVYTLTVEADDGTTQNYVVTVNRAASANAELSDILVNGTSIGSVTSGTYGYTYEVARGIDDVIFTVMKSDVNSTVTLPSSTTFNENTQIYTIVVTAQDGSTSTTYTVTVNRIRSNDADLSSITVSEGTLNPLFDKDTISYTVDVGNNITSIDINAVVSDVGYANVSGIGTKTLIVGVNPYTITVEADDGSTKDYVVTINRAPSSNAELSDILVNGTSIGTITSGSYSYVYEVVRGVDNVIFTTVKAEGNSTVILPSDTTFNEDTQVYTIKVIAEDGFTEKTYTITVNRTRLNNADLDSLTVSEGTLSPVFDKDTISYTVDVINSVTSIDISALVSDTGYANVSGIGTKTLVVGANSYTITVTADDGITTKDYNITITREANSNATLASLSVDGSTLTPVFDSNTFAYEVTVPNSKTTFGPSDVTAVATVPLGATVTKDSLISLNTSLVGNTYNIVVTPESGSSATYIITVYREKSSNADLSDLKVNGTSVSGFTKTNYSYTHNVSRDTTTINITYTKDDGTSTVTLPVDNTIPGASKSFDVEVVAEDGTTQTYTIVVNKQYESNANLATLSVSEGSLTPIFDPDVEEYNVTVANNITSISIGATVSDSGYASISGTGVKTLSVGLNTFKITVTADDGSTKDYYVRVTREANSNATLASLNVSGYTLDPVFNSNILQYEITVPHTKNIINSSEISYTKTASESTVDLQSSMSLAFGENLYKIKVISEDTLNENEYVIKIIRENTPLSSNNNLSGLSVTGYKLVPTFEKGNLNYSVTIPYNVNEVTVKAIKEENSSTISITGNTNLKVGSNKVTVKVVAEDGSIKNYIITVNKQQKPKEEQNNTANKSSNNNLSSFGNELLNEKLDKDVTKYEITVPYSLEKLDLKPIAASNKSKVKVTGDLNLKVGKQVIKVDVTAENGNVRTYEITVIRLSEDDTNDLSLLEVKNHKLDEQFSNEILAYKLVVDSKVKKLDVIYETIGDDTTVEVIGNKSLKAGINHIKVLVKDETGEIVKEYTIEVTKLTQKENKILIILLVLLIISMGCGILFVVIKKNKKKR